VSAAVMLSSYGNVPSERAANLIGMLLGIPVSAGFVDLASERLSARLEDAGFDDAMEAALGKEPVLAADETPSTSWTRMPGRPGRTRAHRTCLSSAPRKPD
jgi:Transposase IS66 family